MLLELPVEIQCEIISLLEVRDIPRLLASTNGQLDDLFLLITDNNDTPAVFRSNITRINIHDYKNTIFKDRILLTEIHDFSNLNVTQFRIDFANKHNLIALVDVVSFNWEPHVDNEDKIKEFFSILDHKSKLLFTGTRDLGFSMESITYPANITVESLPLFILDSLDGSRKPLKLHNVKDFEASCAIEREPLAQIDLSEFPTDRLILSKGPRRSDGYRVVNKHINARRVNLHQVYELHCVRLLGTQVLYLYCIDTPYGDPGIVKNIDAPNLTMLRVKKDSGEPRISGLICPKLKDFSYVCNGGTESIRDMEFLSSLPETIENIELFSYNSEKLFQCAPNLTNLRTLSFSLTDAHRTLSPSDYGLFPQLTKLLIIDSSNVSLPLVHATKLKTLNVTTYKTLTDEYLLRALQLYPCLDEVVLNLHTPSSYATNEPWKHVSQWLTELTVTVDSLENIYNDPSVTFEKLQTFTLTMELKEEADDVKVEFKFVAPLLNSFEINIHHVKSLVLGSYPQLEMLVLEGRSLAFVEALGGLPSLKHLELYAPTEKLDIGEGEKLEYLNISLAQGFEVEEVVKFEVNDECDFIHDEFPEVNIVH